MDLFNAQHSPNLKQPYRIGQMRQPMTDHNSNKPPTVAAFGTEHGTSRFTGNNNPKAVCKVLIVDDSPEDRAELRRMLLLGSDRRYLFTEAETGEACLHACLEHEDNRPDCVILDYHLPDYDAPELLQTLGGLDSPCCPVLVVTGSSGRIKSGSMLGHGAQDFISKNWINPESLTRSLENSIERYWLNQELKASHRRFKAFLENSALIAWMKDDVGKYCYLSDNFQKRYNIHLEDWQGKTDFDLWPERMAEKFQSDDQKVLSRNCVFETVEEALNPDGSLSWWLTSKFPFKDQEGRVFVGGMAVDITDRKRAEDELRNTQARLALVVEEVQAGYWDLDLKTKALYVSPEWNRQIGFEVNEKTYLWQQKDDRLHPDDRAFVATATENFIAGRLPVYELDFRLRHKNGSYRWIHSRAALIRDSNNQPTRMLGLNLDITDYKRTRELNEQRDKMEYASRLYIASQTAAAIAHELNQPLTAVSYYADVAQHLLQSGNHNPEKLARILENCSQQAQRAGQVIRQLMNVLHKGDITKEPVDMNQSVHDAHNFVKANGQLKAFKLELNLAADLPLVMANHLQIQKVLVNLLQNGLEAMRESGQMTGTIAVITRVSANDPATVQVTVCDCGKGVANPAALKTLFQPFFTTKTTGLGMGLAISRALIEAHGGKMWAEQNPDRGISVHFTLPVEK